MVAQKTGIVLVPLNYRLTSVEIDFLLGESNPAAIYFEKQFENKLTQTENFDKISLKHALEELEIISEKALVETTDFHFENAVFDEDHPIFLIFTSGTTSFPKGGQFIPIKCCFGTASTQKCALISLHRIVL